MPLPRFPLLPETPSQTAGPFVHIGLAPAQAGLGLDARGAISNVLVSAETLGERITIEGRVFDGAGAPVRDAVLELWQANAAGRYAHPADTQADKPHDPTFRGFGRSGTDFETGRFRFITVKPGAAAGRHGTKPMAPHVNLWLVARGINIGLATRMYFPEEGQANAADPVLNLIEPAKRRETLVARRDTGAGEAVYTFDIHLQGERETVFFDV